MKGSLRRLLWFVGLWFLGVVAVAGLAYLLHALAGLALGRGLVG